MDDDGPITSINTAGDVFFNGIEYYALTSGSYELNAIDDSSGVDHIVVSIDSGEYITYTSAVTFNTLGEHSIVARAVDNTGNMGNIITLTVNVKDELPTTVMDPSDDLYVASYYASMNYGFTFETSAAYVDVNIDGTGFAPYTEPISFTTEGLHTIEYRGVRADGSYEPASSFEVFIDGTPPTTQINLGTPTYNANPTYITSGNSISLNCNDSASGVGRVEYSINSTSVWTDYSEPFSLVSEGETVIHYRSIDNVGNIESTQSISVFVDDTAPVVDNINPSGPLYTSGELSFAPATLVYTINASDTSSGLAEIKTKIDDGTYQSYASPFGLSEGRHVINYMGTDNLGNNSSDEKTFTVIVDGSVPVSTVSTDVPAYGAGPIYVTNLTNIYILSNDGTGSGISSIEYRFSGEEQWNNYSIPFKISSTEAVVLQYRSRDYVGNQEPDKSIELVPDGNSPQTTISFGTFHSGISPVYIKPETPVTFSADDTLGSGVELIEVSFR